MDADLRRPLKEVSILSLPRFNLLVILMSFAIEVPLTWKLQWSELYSSNCRQGCCEHDTIVECFKEHVDAGNADAHKNRTQINVMVEKQLAMMIVMCMRHTCALPEILTATKANDA